MQPFKSANEMVTAHELMFGDAGRICAELVLRWAPRLFVVPLNPLAIRVVLAPIELGPYNKHRGYHAGLGDQTLILANRHYVQFDGERLVIHVDHQTLEDFIVHELTHGRQAQLQREHEWARVRGGSCRGCHRDRGWYAAISEAAQTYLGVQLPRSCWPTGPRTKAGTLTEVEMTHWPSSIRTLRDANDPRVMAIASADPA